MIFVFQFSVVLFPEEENKIGVVLSKWIFFDSAQKESRAYWPPPSLLKQPNKIRSLLESDADFEPAWGHYACKFLQCYNILQNAMQGALTAEEETNLESESTIRTAPLGKRDVRKPKRYADATDSDNGRSGEDDSSEEEKTKSRKMKVKSLVKSSQHFKSASTRKNSQVPDPPNFEELKEQVTRNHCSKRRQVAGSGCTSNKRLKDDTGKGLLTNVGGAGATDGDGDDLVPNASSTPKQSYISKDSFGKPMQNYKDNVMKTSKGNSIEESKDHSKDSKYNTVKDGNVNLMEDAKDNSIEDENDIMEVANDIVEADAKDSSMEAAENDIAMEDAKVGSPAANSQSNHSRYPGNSIAQSLSSEEEGPTNPVRGKRSLFDKDDGSSKDGSFHSDHEISTKDMRTPSKTSPRKGYKIKSPFRRRTVNKSKGAGVKPALKSDSLKLLLRGQEEIKLKLQLLHINMGRILASLAPQSAHCIEWPAEMPTFPVGDAEKLSKMENFLSKKTNMETVVEVMVSSYPVVDVAGKAILTMVDLTGKVLKDLLSNSLASEFNWIGGNGKRGFEKSNLKRLVDRILRRCFPGEDLNPAYQKIKRWLATAKQRCADK